MQINASWQFTGVQCKLLYEYEDLPHADDHSNVYQLVEVKLVKYDIIKAFKCNVPVKQVNEPFI